MDQVTDLEPEVRARTIEAARFVVEHYKMFSEVFQLRGEKMAKSIEYRDEHDKEPWVPWYGRHVKNAAEIFWFEKEDGPPFPEIRDEARASQRSGKKGLRVIKAPSEHDYVCEGSSPFAGPCAPHRQRLVGVRRSRKA